MKTIKKIAAIMMCMVCITMFALLPTGAVWAEDGAVVMEIHYYMPGNGEGPVEIRTVTSDELSTEEYTVIQYTLTADQCDEYFDVMTERDSVEFQLRYSGEEGLYINSISYGFEGEAGNSYSGENLKKFILGDTEVTHTDFRIDDNQELDDTFMEWDETENAFYLIEDADDPDNLIGRNAIWGMEVGSVKGSGKNVVVSISVKMLPRAEEPEPTETTEKIENTPDSTTTAPTKTETVAPTENQSAEEPEDGGFPTALIVVIAVVVIVVIVAAIYMAAKKKKK